MADLSSVLRPVLIHWIIDELSTLPGSIDWAALKTSVAAKVQAIIPLGSLDQPIDALLDEVIDGLHGACLDQADETALVTACLNKDWTGALTAIKALLAKVVAPTAAQKALLAAL